MDNDAPAAQRDATAASSRPGTNEPVTRLEVHHGRVVRCFADRPADLGAMFCDVVARDPAAAAIVDGDIRLSYAALDDQAERVSRNFWRLGVRPGARIAILLDNRAEFAVAMFAAVRMGAVFVPMNFRLKRSELAFALADCGAEVVIHEAAIAPELPGATELPLVRRRIAVGEGGDWGSLLAEAPAYAPPPLHEDDPLCILYTSGTTGRPKGAVLTHIGVIHNLLAQIHHVRLAPGMATLQAIPVSHVAGLVVQLLTSIALGGRIAMLRDFRAEACLALAEAERIDWAILVPAMYNLCLRVQEFDGFDLSNWRIGLFGGAPMPEAVGAALAERMPHMMLHNVYGATETSAPAVIMPAGEYASRAGKVGRPIIGCDLLVMGEDGLEARTGEPGEIWIGGPLTIPGYWQRPDADAESLVGGYWRSGDIGLIDEDGYVAICDRKKDMIIRGGFKVYSAEVESVLSTCPGVVEAAVTGYSCPVLGERVAATVRVASTDVDESTLKAFCSERLTHYKVPDRFHLTPDPLPRNANGKLQKMLLRDPAADHPDRS